MKFELIPIGQGDYGQTEYCIYVTRNEVLKNFEKDKNSCIDRLATITEMLTTPCCYHSGWQNEDFLFVIERLKEKTTNKGIYFMNFEDEEKDKFKLSFSFKK